jgi:hypothetical protein
MIGALGQVFEHQRMQLGLLRPLQPLAGADLELHMNHAVDQRRGHGAHNRGILSAVASRNHDGALGHHILAHAALQNQAVEGFLHILAAGVELVQEQAIRLLARNHGGRAKAGHAVNDLRHAQQSSGASWLPSRDTQSSPTLCAKFCTSADLPMPGGPR